MGALTLPTSGLVYVDANAVIYAVEHVEPYFSLLTLLWTTSGPASFQIVTSELTLLEVLVRPFKTGNTQLEAGFRALLQQTGDVRLAPITPAILEEAARLRTTANPKNARRHPRCQRACHGRIPVCHQRPSFPPCSRSVSDSAT